MPYPSLPDLFYRLGESVQGQVTHETALSASVFAASLDAATDGTKDNQARCNILFIQAVNIRPLYSSCHPVADCAHVQTLLVVDGYWRTPDRRVPYGPSTSALQC